MAKGSVAEQSLTGIEGLIATSSRLSGQVALALDRVSELTISATKQEHTNGEQAKLLEEMRRILLAGDGGKSLITRMDLAERNQERFASDLKEFATDMKDHRLLVETGMAKIHTLLETRDKEERAKAEAREAERRQRSFQLQIQIVAWAFSILTCAITILLAVLKH